MSPYEIMAPGGSVEHLNPEPGTSLARARDPRLAAHGLDQSDAARRNGAIRISTQMIADIFQRRMFPLTPDGVEAAMRALAA